MTLLLSAVLADTGTCPHLTPAVLTRTLSTQTKPLLTPHPTPSVTGGVIRKTVFYLFVQHLLGIFDCVLGSFRVFSCFLLCSLLFSGMQAPQCGRRRVIRKRFKPRAPSNSLLYKGVPTLIYTSNSLLYNINISHNLGVPLRVEYVHQHIEEQPV